MKILKYLLLLLLAASLLWLAFRGVDLQEVKTYIYMCDLKIVIASFLIGFFAYIVRGLRWLSLIKSIGYSSNKINAINSVSISYFANLIFPRAGEIVRCTTLSKLENIPAHKLLGTVILERIIDLFFLVCISLVTFFLERESISNFFNEVVKIREYKVGSNTSYYILWFVFVVGILCFLLRPILLKFKMIKKGISMLLGIKDGLLSIRNIENKTLFIIQSTIIWVCYFFMNYIMFFAFEETSEMSVGRGFVLLVVGGLSMLVPVQGGIGAFHLSISKALVFFGIHQTLALSFATIVHSIQMLVALLFGGIAFIHTSFIIKNKIVK